MAIFAEGNTCDDYDYIIMPFCMSYVVIIPRNEITEFVSAYNFAAKKVYDWSNKLDSVSSLKMYEKEIVLQRNPHVLIYTRNTYAYNYKNVDPSKWEDAEIHFSFYINALGEPYLNINVFQKRWKKSHEIFYISNELTSQVPSIFDSAKQLYLSAPEVKAESIFE